MTDEPFDLSKRGRVVVVGAGIAGLTAAHELVERGFEVEVVEANYIAQLTCDLELRWVPRVGGMARTQYAATPEESTAGGMAQAMTAPRRPVVVPEDPSEPIIGLPPPETRVRHPTAPVRSLIVRYVATEDDIEPIDLDAAAEGWADFVGGDVLEKWEQLESKATTSARTIVARVLAALFADSFPAAADLTDALLTLLEGNQDVRAALRLPPFLPTPLEPHQLDELGLRILLARYATGTAALSTLPDRTDHVIESSPVADLASDPTIMAQRALLKELVDRPPLLGLLRALPRARAEARELLVYARWLDPSLGANPATRPRAVALANTSYVGRIVVYELARPVPAEHGFRFYPSFYRHLFDSMRRTPLQAGWYHRRGVEQILNSVDAGGPDEVVDDYRTVHDNVLPAEVFRFGADPEQRENDAYTAAFRTAKRKGLDDAAATAYAAAEAPKARMRSRSWPAHRRPPKNLAELRTYLKNLLDDTGYDAESAARLVTRMLAYATSCDARRRTLEEITFKEFIRSEDLDERLRGHVINAAQALVAMSSDRNDARTIAYIALQLYLDQVLFREDVDGILNGPTSREWLRHWRRYLATHGVRFTPGRLIGFEEVALEVAGSSTGAPPLLPPLVRPIVLRRKGPENPGDDPVVAGSTVRFPGTGASAGGGSTTPATTGPRYHDPAYWERVAPADYHVITLPVDALQDLYTSAGAPKHSAYVGKVGTALSSGNLRTSNDRFGAWVKQQTGASQWENELSGYFDFERRREADGTPGGGVDDGPLRWMVGIQFYFPNEVGLIRGHTMCADSAWGVSYLSQPPFWRQKPRFYDGYKGIVSAILTRFDYPAPTRDAQGLRIQGAGFGGLRARETTPEQLAQEVWWQIVDTLDPAEREALGTPNYFYVDENLVPLDVPRPGDPDGAGTLWWNKTEYLVNHVGDWNGKHPKAAAAHQERTPRPGRRVEATGEYEYDLQVGHTYFAGVFKRTHTRLTTMESANESARHAVNALLKVAAPELHPCRIWRLEADVELADLEAARWADEKTFARPGPHGRAHHPHALGGTLTEWAMRATPWELLRLVQRTRRGENQ